MDETEAFEAERPRLVAMASRVLGDRDEAQDVVQQAWLRLHASEAEIESLPAWLTTVTTRLCLDWLRARTPVPVEVVDEGDPTPDPGDDLAMADTVGAALQVVLDRLAPRERVALVLHDSFGVEFATIAAVLDTTPVAARQLASRARAKAVAARGRAQQTTDWEVVDAFMAAARAGDFERLLGLLAPDALVTADAAALVMGTPERIGGARHVATFLNGSAQTAFAVYAGDRPGAAWYDRGRARVLFDFTVVEGRVSGIVFRAEPDALADVVRRDGATRRVGRAVR